MKFLVVFALLFTLASTAVIDDQHEWQQFKAKFNRKYRTIQEENLRRNTFHQNLQLIKEHNELHQQGLSSFTMGVNRFADMTQTEYASMLKPIPKPVNSNSRPYQATGKQAAPDSIDWRTYGYVTPVKDQGACGSVVAFPPTGAVEGAHAAATGELVSLSEINVDYCTFPFGQSCNGGLLNVDNIYNYVINNNGQDAEGCVPQYSYQACFNDTRCKAATISYYTNVPSGDELSFKESCGTFGPIAAFIDASHVSFQLYVSGVYDEPLCSSTQLDHGVLVVGYGTQGTNDYWICKNSWGTSWGEQGYINMSRNKNNQCGIATQASWPTA